MTYTSELRAGRPYAEARHRLGYVPLACGLLLIPWLVVLAGAAGPGWVALDSAETVSLITTGVLALRADAEKALPAAAAATAALLLLDASLDLATSQGPALLAAVAMALLAELPLAAACAALAIRAAPHRVDGTRRGAAADVT